MSIINLGTLDSALQVTLALPAAATPGTTAVIDLQSVPPFGDAWKLGRFAVDIPAISENTSGAGITIALQAAPASLTTSSAAPAMPSAGTFVTPVCAQTITIPAVGATGSVARREYFNLALDANGFPYQFYQFVITPPAQVSGSGEVITVSWQVAE